MSEGAVRAHFAKTAARRIRALPNGHEIRERLPEGLTARLRGLGAGDWLPIGDLIALADAMVLVLGEDGAHEVWTAVIRDTYDHGMLRPLMSEVRDNLGADAAALQLLRLAPQAWALATRECGEIGLEEGEGGLRLTSGGLLPELVRSPGLRSLFYGACRSMLEQFRVKAEITVQVDDAEVVAFEIRRC